jgi:hypothetical protein
LQIEAGRAVKISDKGPRGRQSVQQRSPVTLRIHDGNPATVWILRSDLGDEKVALRGLDDFAGAEQAGGKDLGFGTRRLRQEAAWKPTAENAECEGEGSSAARRAT